MTVCYEIVKAKTEAKRAKEATAKQNKEQRQKRRQQTCADQNALGGQIVAALTHQGQIRTLTAARGVVFPRHHPRPWG